MEKAHFILYVSDQKSSTSFYAVALDLVPTLDVPGMTEFPLPGGAILGLMPSAGIVKLLGSAIPDPASAAGIPRAELYLVVGDAQAHLDRAVGAGARMVSKLTTRDWGHRAGYVLDPDGHVLAFAEGDSNG